MTAFVANTNILELDGLKAAVDDAFINDADVEVTIKDSTGTNVTGVVWPVTMAYVTASEGKYRATLSSALGFVPKKKYTALIEVDAGAGRIGHWELEFKPLTRAVEEAEA
jgi:hypothetical protein